MLHLALLSLSLAGGMGRLKDSHRARKREFARLTVCLLFHKCLYYEHDTNAIPDADYDRLERTWRELGRKLKRLGPEDTSPCVGFDERHPDAALARALAAHHLDKYACRDQTTPPLSPST